MAVPEVTGSDRDADSGRSGPPHPDSAHPDLSRFSARVLMDFYRRQFGTSMAIDLAYRGSVAIWVLSIMIEPIVFIVVWRTVAGSGSTGGFTAAQFVAYYLVLMVVGHLTLCWLMWEFEFRIRTGAFSPLLLRPVHPVHADVCNNLSFKLIGLIGVLPTAVVLAVVFRADFTGVSAMSTLAFLPGLVMAMVLRFVIEWCLALAAFWLTKVSALNNVYFALFTFLGGQFAPLAVLPTWMQTVAAWTPFPGMLALPVEVLLGRRSGADLAWAYAGQVIWIVVGVAALRFLWGRAVRRYGAVGA